MLMSGVYKIQSISHLDRCYIGSAVNIDKRSKEHFWRLKKRNHHSHKLQRHFNKYNESDLVFSILEFCPSELLIQREQYYIDTLNPYFNECKIAGSPLGFKHSEETRKKESEFRKGNTYALGKHWKLSKESIQNRTNSRRGYRHSEETKIKISESRVGQHISEETKRKIGTALRGKKLSKEVCEKRSKTMMGHIISKETALKISKSNKGKVRSKDVIQKMIKYRTGRPQSQECINKRVAKLKGQKRSEESKQRLRNAWVIRKQKQLVA